MCLPIKLVCPRLLVMYLLRTVARDIHACLGAGCASLYLEAACTSKLPVTLLGSIQMQ